MNWFKKKPVIPHAPYTIQDQIYDIINNLLDYPDDWVVSSTSKNTLSHKSGLGIWITGAFYKTSRGVQVYAKDYADENRVKIEEEKKTEALLRKVDKVIRYYMPFEALSAEEKILVTVGNWATSDLNQLDMINSLI